ncbi:D-2-hydroxyacid dehydrogenase [Xanthobacter sp. TB0136]|uniref:D-2-hydroxyacid dehydrogenase n=1 Tax=Xanthobacter sp. TB0136 TaxID=3459177 RepID=UPI0040391A93
MSSVPHIVFLDRETFSADLDLPPPATAHEWTQYKATDADQVVARLKGARIAVINKVELRRATLEQLPDLKFITIAATGYNNVDLDACKALGITVSNVRGYAEHTVPEHAMALMLALRRSILPYRQDVVDGAWQAASQFCFLTHPVADLHGARVGIIGAGNLGQSVARLCQAFGMEVMFAGRKGQSVVEAPYTPFDEVIEKADIITLHLPLTAETRDLLGLPEFRRMKRKPIIINTARGGIVNEADIVTALDEGLISGLGFDVLSTEPPAADNPLLAVAGRANVIITPHVAWASREAQSALWAQVRESIDAFLAGKPVRVLV